MPLVCLEIREGLDEATAKASFIPQWEPVGVQGVLFLARLRDRSRKHTNYLGFLYQGSLARTVG